MKWSAYVTEVPGKWVLAGEHTVLRGGAAIALPHPELKLRLEFRPNDSGLRIEPLEATAVIQGLFEVAKVWLAKRGAVFNSPQGVLRLQSTIPFGAGFGSSAALSVAVANWILSAASMDRSLERELAREMENQFHGKSSGMDVAVVSIGEPILFTMKEGAISLGIQHLPPFRFFDTGLRASTKDCIEKVEGLRLKDPVLATKLDAEMGRATKEALEGLRAYDQACDTLNSVAMAEALTEISRSMDRSRGIYQQWGLEPTGFPFQFASGDSARSLHCRLTGAGAGGFIVGLEA